jgi:hypothetical protein
MTGSGAKALSAMKRGNLYLIVAVCSFSGIFSCRCEARNQLANSAARQNDSVPARFSALYSELNESLDRYERLYRFRKGAGCPEIAPNLFMAMSAFGPAAEGSGRWNDLLLTLDAFRNIKAKAVSVMILAPDLTTGDTKSLVDFYRRLAAEIHSRGLRLYIEHFNSSPSRKGTRGWSDDPAGKQEFLSLMENELRLIYTQIKPDYLSLVTEPGITMVKWTHLSFSPADLACWAGGVAMRLKETGASPNTLLGAGAGTWEPGDFDTAFARQKDIDYIDIHLYPLKLDGEDQIGKLSRIVHDIRAIRPDMTVTIGETWLYKHGGNESGGVMDKEAYYRDNFSFWSPLDMKFLKLLLGIAQKENISVICPYFAQYLFYYYTFGDPETVNLPLFPASVPAAWSKVAGALRENKLSVTGRYLDSLLTTDCP